MTAHSPPAQRGTELSLVHWHICHTYHYFCVLIHHSDCRNLIYQNGTPHVLLLARIKAELVYLTAKSCVIYYHNSNPIIAGERYGWLHAHSFIQSHLWPALHNGTLLKFILHASEWESSMFNSQLTHLCGIKAIRYKGLQNGTHPYLSQNWMSSASSPRDVCCCACRSDWLFMHIRSVVEGWYFYESKCVYKDKKMRQSREEKHIGMHW